MPNPITLLQSYYRWRCRQPDTAPPGSVPNADRVTACWDAEYGWLMVTLTHAGQAGHVIVTGWEDGIHCLTDLDGKPEILPGHLDPGLPVLDPRVEWAQPWRARIPEDVRQILARFTSGRWALLHWASHSPAALELLHSEPILLWLLLITAERKGWSSTRIEACLRLKRRQILGLCGLPTTAAAVRLLSKLSFDEYGRDTLGWLQYGFGEGERLRHARAISLEQLRFMRTFPALAKSALVQSAPAEPGYFETLAQYCADSEQLGRRLGRTTPSVAIRRCRTLDELRRLHDRWTEQLNREQEPAALPGRALRWGCSSNRVVALFEQKLRWGLARLSRYGTPPLPGTATIRPITSYRQLLEEGRSQRHCVASYHDRILAGQYYVYRILAPERCTLGLTLEPGRPPRIDQLKGERNQLVNESTLATVRHWLNAAWPASNIFDPRLEPLAPDGIPVQIPETVHAVPQQSVHPAEDRLGHCDMAIIVVCLESLSEIAQTLHWATQDPPEDRLTVVVTPEPWAFSSAEPRRFARLGRALLNHHVDAVITVSSDAVTASLGAVWNPHAAQALLHATLTHIVQGITDTITRPGLIGVDFTDVHTILKARGESRAAVGMGQGGQRASLATRQAIAQLLAVCVLYEAGGVLACVTGGLDMTIEEYDVVGNVLRETLSEHTVTVISGVIEPDMPPEHLRVCIIAAGVNAE